MRLAELERELGGEMTDSIEISPPLFHQISRELETTRPYPPPGGPTSSFGSSFRTLEMATPFGRLKVTPHRPRRIHGSPIRGIDAKEVVMDEVPLEIGKPFPGFEKEFRDKFIKPIKDPIHEPDFLEELQKL